MLEDITVSPVEAPKSASLQQGVLQQGVRLSPGQVCDASEQPTSASSELDAPTSGSTRRKPELGGLRVLVVEDDDDSRELVAAILAAEGALVESAVSARAGFAALRAFAPALLISDIAMPDEDGYSLMRRIRALGAEAGGCIPAIALTAFTRNEDRREALRAGFTLHVAKPILPSVFVSVIVALMGTIPA